MRERPESRGSSASLALMVTYGFLVQPRTSLLPIAIRNRRFSGKTTIIRIGGAFQEHSLIERPIIVHRDGVWRLSWPVTKLLSARDGVDREIEIEAQEFEFGAIAEAVDVMVVGQDTLCSDIRP